MIFEMEENDGKKYWGKSGKQLKIQEEKMSQEKGTKKRLNKEARFACLKT